ncbi:MAG: acyl-CoA carboxylase subunit beta [Nitrosotalea sp.]
MHSEKLKNFLQKKRKAEQGGGEEKIQSQHEKGKLTARERVDLLLDEGSFTEIDALATHHYHEFDMQNKKFFGDGVLTGYGTINGRKVFLFAYDFTVLGGTLSEMGAKKITKIMEHAIRAGCPIIGIADSGGARIQEGILSLDGFASIFYRNQLASGVVPQITCSVGPSAGGAVYSPAMTDFVIMVDKIATMFVTGPEVVKTVLGEEVSFDELGGAMSHGKISGVSHFVAKNEYQCMDIVKSILSYMPQNSTEEPPVVDTGDDPNRLDNNLINIVPENALQPYDMKEIIHSIVDNHQFFEIHELFAPNVVVGFGRLHGRTVGIVANQPMVLAGALDIDSSNKASRFVRLCDCYNIPIITLVDTPGYMPGTHQEHGGIIRHGSKLLYAYCEATVPKITIIIGKAYGGAYIAMGSKNLGTDMNYAWPTAQIAVLGSEAAVRIMNRKEIETAKDPVALKKQLVDNFTEKFANPYVAASYGTIDTVIDPAETRPVIIRALEALANKRERRIPRKHGNINL